MQLSILIAHHDGMAAATLATSLRPHFRSVALVGSIDDLRSAIVEQGFDTVALDLELVTRSALEELCRKFPQVGFVCIHRLADEELWAQVLSAGAADCCFTTDVAGIAEAAHRHARSAHISAA
ncbi:MAG TPA: hypothetical protein VK473_02825 [Terriglobales bacterium]|nr:hypothetical protein [Terriglobales bacterium]